MPVTVLLVDDSAVIRGLMDKALSANPDIAIVGSAANGSMAVSLAQELKPDIIILDIEMPVMDGITALPELIKSSPRSRIIMASTLTARNASISLQALSLGAIDYLAKPSAKTGDEVSSFYRELTGKILALGKSATPAAARTKQKPSFNVPPLTIGTPLNAAGIAALAIASSTGGPQALMGLFEKLNGHLLNIPVFITQHMPPTFTAIMAEQLSRISGRPCREAAEGMTVIPGEAYVAAGDYHMLAEKQANGKVVLHTRQDPPENFCRPSADPMLRSLSTIYTNQLALLVLTGMGQDGLEGAKRVVENGGSVIAQDEASCVIYGMPKAVAEQQLCKAILPLPEIAGFLIRHIDKGR